jgi:NAD(P)-dependent dehydrogenase (short-subunit alcohol dehydrogenase family)
LSGKIILITGAGRGLGLEFTRQYLQRGDTVFAGCRNPEGNTALKELIAKFPDQLSVVDLEVTSTSSIETAEKLVRQKAGKLDLLINNAGIDHQSTGVGDPESHTVLGALEAKSLLRAFEVNSVAPLIVAQQFFELLLAGDTPKIANVSSILGSLTNTTYRGFYSYYASKTALNMLMRLLAFDVQEDGVIGVLLHPGWVRTDMGGEDAPLSAEESVSGMIEVIEKLQPDQTGCFLDHQGNEVAW